MSAFTLWNNKNQVPFNVSVKATNEPQEPDVKYGYAPILNENRARIDKIKTDDWKKVRWYINEYDFLVKDPIINRAFYKYWEIINEYDIYEQYTDNDLILHCAEAPGGFIQGTNIYLQVDRIGIGSNEHNTTINNNTVDDDGFTTVQKRKRKTKTDYKIYTISLNKDLPQYKAYNLPSYNKNIVNKHICITYGKDDTGDINNWTNIDYIGHIAKNQFFLITADGGFDEGTDFNNKEQLHYNLILSEIYAAVKLQKKGGHFILKVFDIFTETSMHLMYLLSLMYDTISIYKPKTSRPTNSEKYIICKGFILDEDQRAFFISKLGEIYNLIKKTKSKYLSFRLFETIPQEFVDCIHEANLQLLTKQCNFLKTAISLCEDPVFLNNYDTILAHSIEKRKSIFYTWEKQYNLNSFV